MEYSFGIFLITKFKAHHIHFVYDLLVQCSHYTVLLEFFTFKKKDKIKVLQAGPNG